ncbi:MAG: hypothetical protein HY344_02630 [Candidatus Levybacteria bacterium]|nr:hypothetical protein [Candidatus Levybacteria bacterium]
MRKIEKEEIAWDKKKIIATIVIAVLVIVTAIQVKNSVFPPDYKPPAQKPKENVKGLNTAEFSSNIKQSISENVNNLKTQAESLDVAEIASSSPQVQKLINDLKSLKDLPKSQLKSTCERICSGL